MPTIKKVVLAVFITLGIIISTAIAPATTLLSFGFCLACYAAYGVIDSFTD